METAVKSALIVAGALVLVSCETMQSPPATGGPPTFFVTSTGVGKGADLGGIDGADQHCQALAKAAGLGDRTWRAYLSTQGTALNDPESSTCA